MAWIKLIPATTGGGRKPVQLAARLNADGQFSMTHAVAEMLGNPERVIVEIDPQAKMIRLTPTIATNYETSPRPRAHHSCRWTF